MEEVKMIKSLYTEITNKIQWVERKNAPRMFILRKMIFECRLPFGSEMEGILT